MDTLTYKKMNCEECPLIAGIDPSHYIEKAWREVDGKRQLVETNYMATDWPDGYDAILTGLRRTISAGGFAIGVFEGEENLIGFCSVEPGLFGQRHKYILLNELYVTALWRGKGVGKRLFISAAKEARKLGAEKFYICSASAENTVAFYFSLGCTEAMEINSALYEEDPRDYQLEYDLSLSEGKAGDICSN